MSVELSISGGNIDKRCEGVINLLKKNNIYSKVTPNVSICDDGKTELGCTIRLPRKYGDENKNLVIKDWCLIKKNTGIQCGHLWISGKYDGCVLDYIENSVCPHDLVTHKSFS
jgi:hypothetical protein